MKICTGCKNIKDEIYFNKSSKTKDKLDYWCKDCKKKIRKENYSKNKIKELQQVKNYQLLNPDKKRSIRKNCYNKNKNKENQQSKNYNKIHRKELSEKEKIRYNNDINFKLKKNLRSRLNDVLKNKKSGSAVKDLGCTLDELKLHIESQWQKGMNWNNHSPKGWHIDHIIPLSSFDLTDRQQFLKACHYTNLQPLWWEENLTKGAKCE